MFHWWMVYGALTGALVLWTSTPHHRANRQRRGETFGAAVMLAVLWLIWNLSHWFLTPYQQFFTLIDYLVPVGILLVWRRDMQTWKMLLAGLFVAQWPLHWTFILRNDDSYAAKYAYDLALNIIYLGQLGTVAVAHRLRERGS